MPPARSRNAPRPSCATARALARVRHSLGIGTGGFALTLRFDPQATRENDLERFLVEDALPRLAEIAEITGAHFCVADREASTIVPVERQGRPTTVPNWIVIIEGVSLKALNSACDAHLSTAALHGKGCGESIQRDTYSLQIMVTRE